MQRRTLALAFLALFSSLNLQFPAARAQGTAFNYHGKLNDGGSPANGAYDLTFSLFLTNSGGVAAAGPVTNLATAVSNGLFTVAVDFGAGVFTGSNYWLDIAVRTNGGDVFTELTPRQPILPTPYAVMAYSTSNLTGTLPASQLSGTIPLSMLPSAVVTNGAKGVNISGTFTGDAKGLAGLLPQNVAGCTNWWVTATNASVSNLNLSGSFISTNSTSNYFLYNVTGTNPPAAQQPMIAQAIHGGNVNYLDTLLIACAYDLPNNYADIQFGNFNSGNIGSAYPQFNAEAVMGLSSMGGNWNFPYPGQSNYGVYDGWWNHRNSFVLELEGGNPYIIVGDPESGGLIPQVILSRNYEHYLITDQLTGQTNYFDFNKTNATEYLPYGPVVAAGFFTTNGGIYTGDGSGLTNLSLGNLSVGTISTNNLPTNLAALADNNGANLSNLLGANITGVIPQSALPGFQGTYDTVGGGSNNAASGGFATVPGGFNNVASGAYSFAAGYNAQATNTGAFVWSDGTGTPTASVTDNSVTMRASGGFQFFSGTSTNGVELQPNATSWSSLSDRNVKKNFAPVDGEAILSKLSQIPIQQWNYQWENDSNTPHIGPMAQDFKSAFYPGRNDRSISTLEFDGVELAAIQGLNQKLEEQAGQLQAKDAEIQNLKAQSDALQKRLDKLEQTLKSSAEKK
jgi:hypothetical protein